MDLQNLPHDLAKTDARLRSVITNAVDEAPPEHMRRIRVALAAQAAARKPPGPTSDVWLPAGILGVLGVAAVGTTEPILSAATFGIAIGWTYLLARIDPPSIEEQAGA